MVDEKIAAISALETQQKIADLRTATFRRGIELFDATQEKPIRGWQVFRNTIKKPGK